MPDYLTIWEYLRACGRECSNANYQAVLNDVHYGRLKYTRARVNGKGLLRVMIASSEVLQTERA